MHDDEVMTRPYQRPRTDESYTRTAVRAERANLIKAINAIIGMHVPDHMKLDLLRQWVDKQQ